MTPISQDTRLRNLYNQYLYLDDKAFYDKIRFYEQNENDVQIMRLEDSLWIQSEYLEAVFQTGDYNKYNKRSQDYLERLIYHNIKYFHGENPFEEVLHKKAASLYHAKRYDEAIENACQLLNINPTRKDTKKVLFYAHRSSHVFALKCIKAGLMGGLMMTAFLLLFQQLIVATFFATISDWFLDMTMWISLPVFTFFIGYMCFIDLKCRRKVRMNNRSLKE